jgi:hypothetical protein
LWSFNITGCISFRSGRLTPLFGAALADREGRL